MKEKKLEREINNRIKKLKKLIRYNLKDLIKEIEERDWSSACWTSSCLHEQLATLWELEDIKRETKKLKGRK